MEKMHPDTPKPAEKPISLKPLEFKDAVESLLKVKPESRNDAQKPKAVDDD